MIQRGLASQVKWMLKHFPAVGILGPRQCGKSTLARMVLPKHSLYLDLERPSDRSKIQDPESFLKLHTGKLVCLDEIQRAPELFEVLRSILDENGKNGQVLVLGSASPQIIRRSSETLAGRIGYLELTPFLLSEISRAFPQNLETNLRKLWNRGGFPRSFLAASDRVSFQWREDFIRSFLERDIPQLGIHIPAETLRRFWLMCAHSHGQIFNGSQIGQSLGTSHTSIRSYVDLLNQAFILRVLPPFLPNLKKRLVKSPKIYVRDCGLLHALLGIRSPPDLMGHPIYGSSWEGWVIENALNVLGVGWNVGFYRSFSGAEMDLVIERGGKRFGIECKASSSPTVSKGFWITIKDLCLKKAFVVAPILDSYPIGENVWVVSLERLMKELKATEKEETPRTTGG